MQKEFRINIPLSMEEREGLLLSASRDLRDPKNQARHLLRQSLQQAGFLSGTKSPGQFPDTRHLNTEKRTSASGEDMEAADALDKI